MNVSFNKKDKGSLQIAYMLAVEYLKLNDMTRISIGKELDIVDEMEIMSGASMEVIDAEIFKGVFRKNLVPQFAKLVYEAQNE